MKGHSCSAGNREFRFRFRRRFLRAGITIAAFAALTSLSVSGQAAQKTGNNKTADKNKPVMEEIVVTASRRPETLQNTAMSVSVVQPEKFAAQGLATMQDVLAYTPGVVFSGGAGPTDNSISMRGISTFTSAPTVGIYIDDVPIGSGNAEADGATLALDIMQMDIQRVEVIKGPQGTRYGASSMGGIIRYITADPSMNGFSGDFGTDFSHTERGGFNPLYSGRISAPIVKDKIGLSVSGFYKRRSGFIDRVPQAASGAASDVNGYDTYGVMTKLVTNFTDSFTGSLLYLHTQNTYHGQNLVPLKGGPPFVLAYGRYDTDTSYSDYKDRFSLYALTLKYDLDWAQLISSTSYQKRKHSAISDLVADFGPLITLFSGSPTTSAPFTGATTTNKFVQELRLVSSSNQSIEWSVGGIYSRESSGNLQRLLGLPANFLLLDVNVPTILEEYAGFGELTYYFTPKVDVTAGMRFSHVKTSIAVVDGPQILVTDVPPMTSTDNIKTYSLSVRYRPNPDLSLYARAASGYRPPTGNIPVKDVNGNNVAPPVVQVDTLWSYEIGAKGWLADSKIQYDVDSYYILWHNLQARIYVNGAQTGGNANSNVTAYGMESTLTYFPFKRLSIIASATYTHSTLDHDETSAFGALAGEKIPGVPNWTGSLRARYGFPIGYQMDGFVNAGIRYVGSRNTGFHGGIGANGQVITPLIQNFVLNHYAVVDLSAGVTRGNVSATLYVTNLFDKYAYSFGVARPAVGFIRAQATVIEPRVIGATIKVDF